MQRPTTLGPGPSQSAGVGAAHVGVAALSLVAASFRDSRFVHGGRFWVAVEPVLGTHSWQVGNFWLTSRPWYQSDHEVTV